MEAVQNTRRFHGYGLDVESGRLPTWLRGYMFYISRTSFLKSPRGTKFANLGTQSTSQRHIDTYYVVYTRFLNDTNNRLCAYMLETVILKIKSNIVARPGLANID